MDQFNQDLINFLKNGTCIFTCIKTIKEILLNNNFQELTEEEIWNLEKGKYFVIRNDATL